MPAAMVATLCKLDQDEGTRSMSVAAVATQGICSRKDVFASTRSVGDSGDCVCMGFMASRPLKPVGLGGFGLL